MRDKKRTHALVFLDGSLEGTEFNLTDVVPFAQFQIAGTMEVPLFHFYALLSDGEEVKRHRGTAVAAVFYKFRKTFGETEMAQMLSNAS